MAVPHCPQSGGQLAPRSRASQGHPARSHISASLRTDAPDKKAEEEEELDASRTAICQLPEDRQQLLLLKFVERLSNAEIGEIMDRTEGAVKSLYHRTLLSLRETLELNYQGLLKELSEIKES